MNNPFTTKIETKSPMFTLSALALVLGVLFGLAWTTAQKRPKGSGLASPPSVELVAQLKDMQTEVGTLRTRVAEYEKAASADSAKLLQQSLKEYRIAAGLTALSGPGIVITLTDSSKRGTELEAPVEEAIIHDSDLIKILNECWIAGAEAIAIEDQRIVGGSPIRCVGPSIQVNYVSMAAPIRIKVIGDPVELQKALNLPGGIVEELILVDPKMIKIEAVTKMTIPPFKGQISKKLSTVPIEAKK